MSSVTNFTVVIGDPENGTVEVCVVYECGGTDDSGDRIVKQAFRREELTQLGRSPKKVLAGLAGALCSKLLIDLIKEGKI